MTADVAGLSCRASPSTVSPLSSYADRLGDVAVRSAGALSIGEVPFVSMVNLRVDAAGAGAAAVVEVLGIDRLPSTGTVVVGPGVVRGGDSAGVRVLGLGPDEWLVLGAPDTADAVVDGLRSALTSLEVDGVWSVVDVSAARTTIGLAGPAAREVLAHGCALDLDRRAFGAEAPLQCAQTMLARAQVVLVAGDDDGVQVLVRSSFAIYLVDWLLDACLEWVDG